MRNTQETSTPTIEARYQQAQALIQGFTTQELVQNDTIFPTWIEGTDCFWYERAYKVGEEPSVKIGKEYRLVDAATSTNSAAFDHSVFAKALAQSSGHVVDMEDLPISHITITPLLVRFTAFDRRWQYNENSKACEEVSTNIVADGEVRSPDGKWVAFSRDYNLWIRNLATSEERALTSDGEKDNAYAIGSTAWGMPLFPDRPALWSPDSAKLLTVQRDKRLVKTLPMVNHTSKDGGIRPVLEQVKVAYPGDINIETYQLLTFNVVSGKACVASYQQIPVCDNDYYGFFGKLVWWSEDSQRVYFIDQERGDRVVRLVELNTETGATRILFDETSETQINLNSDVAGFPLHRILPSTNELIWWSERSGWGHLYLYDLNTGSLKQTVTSGDWRVRDVLHVDEIRRELFIQTSARVPERDPYYRDICRVQIDTGEFTTLLSSDHEAVVHYQNSFPVLSRKIAGLASKQTSGVSPNGNYVVTTLSRADQTPISLLIDREGKEVMKLETANISSLPDGWQWPEPVKLRAGDGKTDIYGLLFRPSDFSPNTCYPVINYIVSSPKLSVVPKGSFHNSRGYIDRHYFYGAALAELGFIVVLIDSRGTPLRSKAFQDESYGWIPSSANKMDHMKGLQQLAKRYPFMDINRVGIFTNGYRSGLQNFLENQELYKVCVVMSQFDSRLMGSTIDGDKWEGCEGPSNDKRYPEQLVNDMQGKLLLMHAMTSLLSASYPPAATFRVIDSLQKANKNFDMLIVSDGGYLYTSYMMRRAWDYLVQHLQHIPPPKEFKLKEVNVSA